MSSYEIARTLHLLFMALWLGSMVKGLADSITLAGTSFTDQNTISTIAGVEGGKVHHLVEGGLKAGQTASEL